MDHIEKFLQYLSDSAESQITSQETAGVSVNEYILNDMDHTKKRHERLKENSRFGLYFTNKQPSDYEKDVPEVPQSLSQMKEDLYRLLSLCQSTIDKVESFEESICHISEEKEISAAFAAIIEEEQESATTTSTVAIPNVKIPYAEWKLPMSASVNSSCNNCTAETATTMADNEAEKILSKNFSDPEHNTEDFVAKDSVEMQLFALNKGIRSYEASCQNFSEAVPIPISLQDYAQSKKYFRLNHVTKKYKNNEKPPVPRARDRCGIVNIIHRTPTTNIIELPSLLKNNSKQEAAFTMDRLFQEAFENNMRRHGVFKTNFQLSMSS